MFKDASLAEIRTILLNILVFTLLDSCIVLLCCGVSTNIMYCYILLVVKWALHSDSQIYAASMCVGALPSVLWCCWLGSGRQEGHPACKNWVVTYWRGYLCGARYKWCAYGPADATATPSSFAPVKSRMVLPFWCQLTQVVLEKKPLNGCVSVCA